MSEPFLAEILMFGGNFAPRGWAFCQGQILSIAQNTALFSLLGTTFGGNGQTTFALPDFRGRVAVGTGQGPGLPAVNLGEIAGEWNHTLIITEMPAHNHLANAATAANSEDVAGKLISKPFVSATGDTVTGFGSTANTTLAANTIGISGGSQPHNNMQPYLGMNYLICIAGIYPSRN